jgi:lipopolysaccharide/colanic/teichoic acid biosynthesis glycosyltransferase
VIFVTTETRTIATTVSLEQRCQPVTIRILDLALALVVTVLVLPILIVAALAVRLTSPGPAIFRQRRLGLDGHPFTVFKFRTMRADAEQSRHREYVQQLILSEDSVRSSGDEHDQLFKLVVDDRITRVGRFLRRTSLDELPQFWNVVRGEMSLVGPRPVIPYEADIYPDAYRERFHVKPGITGLWQVSGRNQRTYDEMVQLDIEYVRHRSLKLYLGILARTVPAVLFRKGVA